MTDIQTGADGTISKSLEVARPGIADWLCLAAAPTFLSMALYTLLEGGDGAMSCLGANPSPFTGMPAMYLLMSAFHLAPWLRAVSGNKVSK